MATAVSAAIQLGTAASPAVGARSASYLATFSGGAGAAAIANAELNPASLPAGALKDFLSATYATSELAATAFAALGGSVSAVGGTASFSAIRWAATASTPTLSLTSSADGVCAVRISLAASIAA